jgi:hypothetical protein
MRIDISSRLASFVGGNSSEGAANSEQVIEPSTENFTTAAAGIILLTGACVAVRGVVKFARFSWSVACKH